MNVCSCCQKPTTQEKLRSVQWFQRLCRIAKWVVPGAIFVAMPKCPACVATYVALITGVSISLPAAAHLRILLLTPCVAALVFHCQTRLLRRHPA